MAGTMGAKLIRMGAAVTNDSQKSSRKLKVWVDHGLCVGTAMCVELAPAALELDAEGQAVAREGAAQVDDKAVLDAALDCPVSAIVVSDAATGEQLFPYA
jgi:ferredoxin